MPANRLRVLRVIARMNVGGPALQVTGLVDGMDVHQFEHRLLTGFVGPDEADYLELRAPHVRAVRVPGLGREPHVAGDLRALRTLYGEMRRFQPHVVHTHTAKAGVLGRVSARAAGVPATVHTFHGHLLHGYFSPAVTKAVIGVERGLARSTSRLVAVGEQVRDELLAAAIGRPEQYVVVPPGIHLPPLPSRASARAALGLPPDAVVAVFVARLTQIKRPERFLAIAAALRDRHPDALFVVVGEGDLLPALQQAAGPNVRFLGWRGDVERVYAASDLVVLTSDNEGMPVSLIEAALCGVPAVSTRVGSAGEVVLDGRSGLLAAPDVAELTAQVDRLLADGALRRSMGEAAQVHATSSYGRARLVADTERLYQEIAVEKGFA